MVSQDLIYSVLPRHTGQVEHKNRMVEKVVRRSSLKAIDEHESSSQDVVVTRKEGRGDRRTKDRRQVEIDTGTPTSSTDRSDDNEDNHSLDVFV